MNESDKRNDERNANKRVHSIQNNPSAMAYNKRWSS